jgi:hypothetical protein
MVLSQVLNFAYDLKSLNEDLTILTFLVLVNGFLEFLGDAFNNR